jgi:hypothetical protein
MSFLSEHPEVMMEVIAVLVQRAGGSVEITKAEAPGPFNLLTKFDGHGSFFVVREDITHEEVDRLKAYE